MFMVLKSHLDSAVLDVIGAAVSAEKMKKQYCWVSVSD